MSSSKIVVNRSLMRKIGLHAMYILLALLMLYPVMWMIMASFKTQAEIFSDSLKLLPEKFLFSNYVEGWKGFGNQTFGTFFLNSIMVSVIATCGALMSASMVGFGFARNRFAGKNFWLSMMMATMMIPYPIIMIPQYLIYHKIGFVNTYIPLLLPSFFGIPFFIYLVTQFMRGIPKELDESAVIDGCSKFGLFLRIMVPLSKSALFTVAIFSFYWRWNDFVQAMIYLNKPQMYTVSVALRLFADPTAVTNWGAMLSMSVLSIIPVFCVFFFLQRHVTEGISSTGIKG